MAKVPFTVSARTARLIGRENVSNAEGALIELVKNCYDADSPFAIIVIDKKKDTLLIIDSGHGMNEKIIRNNWMTIGTDDKLYNPTTSSGRIKAGAKGIGRFALDRLGEKCTMISYSAKTAGVKWDVSWNSFDQLKDRKVVKTINQVYASLTHQRNSSYKAEISKATNNAKVHSILKKKPLNTGTVLKITGLRDDWSEQSTLKIYESLELLTPPDGAAKMEVWFIDASDVSKFGLVKNSTFQDYDYKVTATYRKNRKQLVNVSFHRNEFDLSLIDGSFFRMPEMKKFPYNRATFIKEKFAIKKKFSELLAGFKDSKNYLDSIGDFEFTLYFLKNTFSKVDKGKFKYKDITTDRGAWLKKFGGIKLYRDNFRVRPYGEIGTASYDWLMLGERQNLNPAGVSRRGGGRVRPNQVAGVVRFSRINNPFLDDKSSREGLQENETFYIFKNILLSVIKMMEEDRSTIAYNLNELFMRLNEEQRIIEESKAIAELPANEEENEEVSKQKTEILKKGIIAQRQQLEQKEEEIAISRAMATAGIMIASFSHEFYGIRNDLVSRIADIRKYLEPVIDRQKLSKVPARHNPIALLELQEASEAKLKQWIEFSIGLTQRDRRQNKQVSLVDYFDNFSELWTRLFKERNISFSVRYKKTDEELLRLKISEVDLDTIFDNLIANSIEAFQQDNFNGSQKISIVLTILQNGLKILYKDSGPGINKSYSNIYDILNPFETSKKDDLGNDIGTGLGMWLVKTAVDTNKGQLEIHRPSSGFQISFYFNSKRSL
jgi:signal transduction histidine kinase